VASPQTENGHTSIADELLDALVGIRISGEENQCLLFIIRKTYGWKKKEDWISLSQFQDKTGMAKPSIIRALKKLIDKNMIYKKVNARGVSYGIQKNYKKWKPLTKKLTINKKATVVDKKVKEDLQKSNSGFTKKLPTIETLTRKTFTIETSTRESIVEYLNSVLGTNYKPSGQKTKIVINARLAEGHTLEDFKIVIDKKYAEWVDDPEYSKFLRPETLFGNKFEGYLNQKAASKKQSKNELRIAEIMNAERN
jgi:phage replication O-like protein O